MYIVKPIVTTYQKRVVKHAPLLISLNLTECGVTKKLIQILIKYGINNKIMYNTGILSVEGQIYIRR